MGLRISMKAPVYAPSARVVSPHGVPAGGSARKLTLPVFGAVQRYQAENAVAPGPDNVGSFGSRVKFVLSPVTLPLLPLISRPKAKSSFESEPVFQVSTVRPVSPVTPSIAMKYVPEAWNSTYSGLLLVLLTT